MHKWSWELQKPIWRSVWKQICYLIATNLLENKFVVVVDKTVRSNFLSEKSLLLEQKLTTMTTNVWKKCMPNEEMTNFSHRARFFTSKKNWQKIFWVFFCTHEVLRLLNVEHKRKWCPKSLFKDLFSFFFFVESREKMNSYVRPPSLSLFFGLKKLLRFKWGKQCERTRL